jgi:acetylornithine deacetylase/succinyl-diaminopimelate desuccinylase-like protein
MSEARVLEAIDEARQDLADLCIELGNLTDYSGEELAVGRAVVDWLGAEGIEAWLQHMSPTSVNAVGLVRGCGDRDGGGRSLILNAHMDTQGARPAGGETAESALRGAWAEDGFLYGRGVANDKAQLASQLIALRAIVRAGVRLKEDLFVGATGQETWAPPGASDDIPSWSGLGPRSSQVREGHGARWLVEHGVVADYALVGEVSDFRVTVAQAGYLRLRIAVPGNLPYTPGIRRGDGPAGSPNPFERASRVVLALEDWARSFEVEGRREFWGGTLVPKAQVLEMRPAGPPWTEVADYCHIFFDVRLMPGVKPAPIRDAVRSAVAATGIAADVSAYDYKQGFIAENAEPLLDALRAAHRDVVGGKLDFAASLDMSMWRDSNAFNEAGIPAIGYGPPVRDSGGPRGAAGVLRPVSVDDLAKTAKVFALTALRICGVAKSQD